MSHWTKEQQIAIETRGKNLLVSAAAGSGKTAVLTERIVRLVLDDKIDIDKILVATFTKAAAEEMKNRIQKALYKSAENEEFDNEITKQIKLLKRASISTMHSFCLDVIRENFFALNIDPNFKVGDTLDLEILKKEAFDELFQEAYSKQEEVFFQLIDIYSSNRNDIGFREKIEDIYDFIQSKPDPVRWLEEKVCAFNCSRENILESEWIKVIIERAERDLKAALIFLNNAEEYCIRENWIDGYLVSIKKEKNDLIDLLDTLNEDFGFFYSKLSKYSFDRLCTKNPNGIDKELKEVIKGYREQAKEILLDLKEEIIVRSFEEKIFELKEYYNYGLFMIEFIKRYIEIYKNKKETKGIIDFNDIEHYALEILSKEEIADKYREKFEYIFVDEYQDSNSVQEAIINFIKREQNLFFVGDVKQSIYRFRMAEPKLFIEKYNLYSSQEDMGAKIDLNKNFRSKSEILKGINFIFENIMTGGPGEVEYDVNSKLYFGKSNAETEEAVNAIEILLVDKKKDGYIESINEDVDDLSSAEIEAKAITQKIKYVIENEMRYDETKKELVKIEYKDVVILVRSLGSLAAAVENEFKKEGMPIYCEVNGEYFNNIDVSVFMNLIRLLDNKKQDIPLISVLRSAIVGITDDEFAMLSIFQKKIGKRVSFYETVIRYSVENDDDLSSKIAEFLNRLNDWLEMSIYMDIDLLIWKIINDTGYIEYLLLLNDGEKRYENIKLLIKKAENFRKGAMKGIFNFIRYIDKIKLGNNKVKEAKIVLEEEGENKVRMMTIHKSKGLEFPVVVVAGLGKKFNKADFTGKLILHGELGLCPDYVNLKTRQYYPTLAKIAAKNKIKFENISEEMRILYVAFTRAKEKLILTGVINDIEKRCREWSKPLNEYVVINDERYLDWIGRVIIRDSENNVLRNISEKSPDGELYFGNSKWNVEILNSNIETVKTEEKKVGNDEINIIEVENNTDENYFNCIFDKLKWGYEFLEMQKMVSKISVTDIENKKKTMRNEIEKELSEIVKKPKFMVPNMEISGAEKGELVHAFMQNINFEKVIDKEYISKEKMRMVEEGYFTKKESEAINDNQILKFFKSDIGERLVKSAKLYREIPFCFLNEVGKLLEVEDGIEEEIVVQGIIDCFFEENGKYILIDYKTDYINEENREKLVIKYTNQLQIYKEAIEKITEKKVAETYIYLFGIGEGVRVI